MSERYSAVLHSPGKIVIARDEWRLPGPDDLVIIPDAVGICGTDIELYDGTMAYLKSGFATYPIIPGHEWTGIVTELGGNVHDFAIGDRVVGECSIGCGHCVRCLSGNYHLCPTRTETGIAGRDGAMSSRLVFPSRSAHHVPLTVDRQDAALIEPLAVAVRAVKEAGIPKGAPVTVMGAGTIGLLTAMTAQKGDAEVTVVDPQLSRVEFAQQIGLAASQEIPAQSPFVIEASGTQGGVRSAVGATSDGGRIILLGLAGEPFLFDFDQIVVRVLTVTGSLGSPSVWKEAIALVAENGLLPSRLISDEFYGLMSTVDAFSLVANPRPETRKVLVNPSVSAAG